MAESSATPAKRTVGAGWRLRENSAGFWRRLGMSRRARRGAFFRSKSRSSGVDATRRSVEHVFVTEVAHTPRVSQSHTKPLGTPRCTVTPASLPACLCPLVPS